MLVGVKIFHFALWGRDKCFTTVNTFFLFFQLLHDALMPFHDQLQPPTMFLPIPTGDIIAFKYLTIIGHVDQGECLVHSIVAQYIRLGRERTPKREINYFSNIDLVWSILRWPVKLDRFRRATIDFPLTAEFTTPFQAVQQAIRFVVVLLFIPLIA